MNARLRRCGEHAVLVELDRLDEVVALYDALTADTPPGVADIVPAARTVLIRFEPPARHATVEAAVEAAAESAVLAVRPGVRRRTAAEEVVVPVVYDGDDLGEVAALTGLTEREVVAAHTGTPWTVAFCGFAPGFGYLVGGDPRLAVPRRPESRVRVPPGAVGLAGEFSGVYPRESPGGWRLIGRTETVVWDVAAEPPALLRPGVLVRFSEAL
ncbi:allophanate hydrolase subunit 1 [Microbispora sp. H11081]|uniref:5-oxoprolinase subunit B family protein n=1 Tax=Microbispora sp. H11081 TaxID=2729107 RepID=UPI001473EC0A|nr:allophanate hydrolase subunit 1 [Microbispora sp. H11081]